MIEAYLQKLDVRHHVCHLLMICLLDMMQFPRRILHQTLQLIRVSLLQLDPLLLPLQLSIRLLKTAVYKKLKTKTYGSSFALFLLHKLPELLNLRVFELGQVHEIPGRLLNLGLQLLCELLILVNAAPVVHVQLLDYCGLLLLRFSFPLVQLLLQTKFLGLDLTCSASLTKRKTESLAN